MESKLRFYRLKYDCAKGFLFSEEELKNLKGKYFCFFGEERLDGSMYVITIRPVYAVLVDRIIFENELRFFIERKEDFYKCFEEVDINEVKEKTDNTNALLSRSIFRR